MQWVTDRDPKVRYHALLVLSRHARQEDADVLRAAFKDKDSTNAHWAFRGIVRLRPPGIDALLRQSAKSPDSWISGEAVVELARRGDAAALRRLLVWVKSYGARTPDPEGCGLSQLQDVCQLLAERKDRGAVPALVAGSQNPHTDVQRPVFGALAALGYSGAIDRVRRFAREGDALDRADAIRWLGLLKDRDSRNLLRQQRHDPEPWVRDAAKEALARVEGRRTSSTQ
jgi:HEAT repeat protein